MISLKVSDFRTIEEALIPLDARAVVLLGKNDTGKSNILDAIELSLTGEHSRGWEGEDGGYDELHHLKCELEFDLDCLGMVGHYDEDVFFGGFASLQLESLEKEGFQPFFNDELDSLRKRLADEEITDHERTQAVNRFNRVFIDDLRDIFLDAGETCSTDWPAIESDYRIVLNAYLASRRFRAGKEGISWLTPSSEGTSPSVREARERLATALWSIERNPLYFLGRDPDIFQYGVESYEYSVEHLCSVGRVEFSKGDYKNLATDVESFVRSVEPECMRTQGRDADTN